MSIIVDNCTYKTIYSEEASSNELIIGLSDAEVDKVIFAEKGRVFEEGLFNTTIIESTSLGVEPADVLPDIFSEFRCAAERGRINENEISLLVIIKDLDVLLDKACVFEIGMYMQMLKAMLSTAEESGVFVQVTARVATIEIQDLFEYFGVIEIHEQREEDDYQNTCIHIESYPHREWKNYITLPLEGLSSKGGKVKLTLSDTNQNAILVLKNREICSSIIDGIHVSIMDERYPGVHYRYVDLQQKDVPLVDVCILDRIELELKQRRDNMKDCRCTTFTDYRKVCFTKSATSEATRKVFLLRGVDEYLDGLHAEKREAFKRQLTELMSTCGNYGFNIILVISDDSCDLLEINTSKVLINTTVVVSMDEVLIHKFSANMGICIGKSWFRYEVDTQALEYIKVT